MNVAIFFSLYKNSIAMFDEYACQLMPYSLFGDVRIERRFIEMIRQVGNCFGKSLTQSARDETQLQAFYHFFCQPTYGLTACF